MDEELIDEARVVADVIMSEVKMDVGVVEEGILEVDEELLGVITGVVDMTVLDCDKGLLDVASEETTGVGTLNVENIEMEDASVVAVEL
jgi:hypothetical protein